jgi:glycine/D-amino acid oxidase-like deaminating enzyme
MQVDYLIIGQGISGTWLSYYFLKAGKSFLVIDNELPNSSSRIAAGIINPVTGRRIVKTWMIDELLAFLVHAYEELGKELHITTISQRNIIDFHPTPQMKLAFEERLNEKADFLYKPDEENDFRNLFNYDFGYGIIQPCYMVNLKEIIPAWRKKLQKANYLLKDNFELAEIKESSKGILYKNISAGKIIFCDGITATQNPYFKNLPFALNKGEVIIIESENIPTEFIFKKGLVIAPLGNQFYWVGSNNQWDFADDKPTAPFRLQAETLLKNWLKIPFKIADHAASVRPANLERRPFIGFHPVYQNIGIMNGMGAKGCSLAPYFAKQLVDYELTGKKIDPLADIARFQKILSR